MGFRDELFRQVKGEILENELLSRHTSFGIGGPADFFVRPKTEKEILAVLSLTRTHGLPIMVIGLGTNLLVGDGGVRGVVLDLSLACRQLLERSGGVVVGAAVSVAELVDFCVHHELEGLEFMAGIPGSVGGAVKVNAGAWDESIGQRVRAIRGYDSTGGALSLKQTDVRFHYRGADLPKDLIITEVDLAVTHTSRAAIEARIKKFLRRRSSQPMGQRSAGCVFKNPPGVAAGKLIEESGCKGLRVGGAEVSPKHANFIVNLGEATAAEVKQLIERVRQKVKDRLGIELEMEIIWVGEE